MPTETSQQVTNQDLATMPYPPFIHTYWKFSEIVIFFSMVLSMYILVCLARYASVTRCRPGRELSGGKGKVLYRMCLVSVAMAVARFVADQAGALIGWQTNTHCLVTVSVSTVFYALSLYPVYIFLWLRQSIFYANPVLSHVLNPAVTVISYATLFVMLGTGSVLIVVYVIPDTTGWIYAVDDAGCQEVSGIYERGGFDVVPLLVVCFSTAFQISLLALFIYPLLSRKTRRYRSAEIGSHHSSFCDHNKRFSDSEIYSNGHALNVEEPHQTETKLNGDAQASRPSFSNQGNDMYVVYKSDGEDNAKNVKPIFRISRLPTTDIRRTSSGSSGTSDRNNRRNKTVQGRRVIRFIRKAFILTLICVLSDAAATVSQLLIKAPEIVYLAIFDLNLLVNILCIVMSFRDWPAMIMPMCASMFVEKMSSCGTTSAANGTRTNTSRLILTMAQSKRERSTILAQHGNGLRVSPNSSNDDNNGIAKDNSDKT